MRYSVFSRYHPIITVFYFLVVWIVTMVWMHPFVLGITFLSSLTLGIELQGKNLFRVIRGALIMAVILTLFNILFNHRGETILWYLNDNPVTLESIVYGIVLGLLFLETLMVFSSFNLSMDSEKILIVTSCLSTNVSLLLSMIFRFVPLYKQKYHEIRQAQQGFRVGFDEKHILRRFVSTINCLSMLVTFMLENSIHISDAMKARGFGSSRRTSFQPQAFKKRDLLFLGTQAICFLLMLCFLPGLKYSYSPFIFIKTGQQTFLFALFFACFSFLPVFQPIFQKGVSCQYETASR